jgi:hypothetical protein
LAGGRAAAEFRVVYVAASSGYVDPQGRPLLEAVNATMDAAPDALLAARLLATRDSTFDMAVRRRVLDLSLLPPWPGTPTASSSVGTHDSARLPPGGAVSLIPRLGWLDAAGEQALVAGGREVSVFWSASPDAPGPYDIVVEQAGRRLARAASERRLDVHLQLDEPIQAGQPGRILIRAGAASTSIPFRGVERDGEPAPEELPAALRGRPQADGAWGAWLLLEAPPRWRLQGFARLARGARDGGDYAAARLISAVAAGDFFVSVEQQGASPSNAVLP